MKILSIGNSFSQDAQRYIYRIASLNGVPMKTVNLYIGGCPLRKHYFNIIEDARAYEFQFNGEPTGISISVKDALMSDTWDYVTLQQASFYSNKWESYEPYLDEISACVKKYAPEAKLVIHQTWAYDEETVLKRANAKNPEDMLSGLIDCYNKMEKHVGAVGTVPSGEAIAKLCENKIFEPYRDGCHVSLGCGRLTLGLLWCAFFVGLDPESAKIPELDVPVSEEEIREIRRIVKSLVSK